MRVVISIAFQEDAEALERAATAGGFVFRELPDGAHRMERAPKFLRINDETSTCDGQRVCGISSVFRDADTGKTKYDFGGSTPGRSSAISERCRAATSVSGEPGGVERYPSWWVPYR
jgi:hypothetical protein